MDSAALARLVETVGSRQQDSLTIIRHGRIVADAGDVGKADANLAVMRGLEPRDDHGVARLKCAFPAAIRRRRRRAGGQGADHQRGKCEPDEHEAPRISGRRINLRAG